LEDAKEEILQTVRTELREKLTAIQEAILQFYKEWRMGQPPIVKKRLDDYECRISILEDFQ
jgi:hypothetical protein